MIWNSSTDRHTDTPIGTKHWADRHSHGDKAALICKSTTRSQGDAFSRWNFVASVAEGVCTNPRFGSHSRILRLDCRVPSTRNQKPLGQVHRRSQHPPRID